MYFTSYLAQSASSAALAASQAQPSVIQNLVSTLISSELVPDTCKDAEEAMSHLLASQLKTAASPAIKLHERLTANLSKPDLPSPEDIPEDEYYLATAQSLLQFIGVEVTTLNEHRILVAEFGYHLKSIEASTIGHAHYSLEKRIRLLEELQKNMASISDLPEDAHYDHLRWRHKQRQVECDAELMRLYAQVNDSDKVNDSFVSLCLLTKGEQDTLKQIELWSTALKSLDSKSLGSYGVAVLAIIRNSLTQLDVDEKKNRMASLLWPALKLDQPEVAMEMARKLIELECQNIQNDPSAILLRLPFMQEIFTTEQQRELLEHAQRTLVELDTSSIHAKARILSNISELMDELAVDSNKAQND